MSGLDGSALIAYGTDILDGRIAACDKIKRVYEQRLNAVAQPGKYHFDLSLATPHIDFIQTFCKQSQGKKMGQPLALEPFQRSKLECIFGFVDDNNIRQFNECMTVEGRKNGKTTESSGLAYDMLINDGEGAPEIYFIATAEKQSKKGFNECCNMRLQSPVLKKHVRKRKSDLWFGYNLGYIMALASNTGSLDGLNAHMAIVDELAAIKDRDVYDLLKQSMGAGAREQPLMYEITTNGFVRECIFDQQYAYACKVIDDPSKDEHFLPLIYELDPEDDWRNPDVWIKANPGLGTVKSFKFLADGVKKAVEDESYRPTVLVKDFNRKETSIASWLRGNEIFYDAVTPADAQFKYAIGGIDAADSIDLAAAKALCMRPGDDRIFVKSMYWMPEEKLNEICKPGTRRERDNAPYKLWKTQGLLRTVPGHKVTKRAMMDWFVELRDKDDIFVLYIGYDPWHMDDNTLEQFKSEFGANSMIPITQGAKTMSAPMKDWRADLDNKRFVRDNNSIDQWCMANAAVKSDINCNIQLVKSTDSRMRIDGLAAELDAYIVLVNKYDEYTSMI